MTGTTAYATDLSPDLLLSLAAVVAQHHDPQARAREQVRRVSSTMVTALAATATAVAMYDGLLLLA